MNTLGRHILVELYDCTPSVLSDVIHIENAMVEAARVAQATVINSTFHHFSPFGVSGVVVIQESHLAIHTWPEYGYAAIDVFTCGDSVNPWDCYNYLLKALEAGNGSAMEMGRGQQELLNRQELQVKAHGHVQELGEVDPKMVRNVWFTERDHYVAMSLRHKGDILYRQQSDYQKVEVYDTYQYGKMLTLDGAVMTTEGDEYVYHEMITHLPMLLHPAPKRVLVIGGGDGGAVRELVKHPNLVEVVMVEIDQLVIDASKAHLPTIAASFDHPKLTLHVADGLQYVRQAPDQSFDIVIVDSTDPVGPGEGLFTEAFYRDVHRILSADGIMVTQSESPRFNTRVFQEIYQCYRGVFGSDNVHCYLIQVPTYPSGTWSLSLSSKGGLHPVRDFDAARAQAFCSQQDLQYYNPELHTACFALPNFVRKLLG
jgi:spermidine synthase